MQFLAMAGAVTVVLPLRNGKGAETVQVPQNPRRMYLLVVNTLASEIKVEWDVDNSRTQGKRIGVRDSWIATIHQRPFLSIHVPKQPFI